MRSSGATFATPRSRRTVKPGSVSEALPASSGRVRKSGASAAERRGIAHTESSAREAMEARRQWRMRDGGVMACGLRRMSWLSMRFPFL